MKLEKNNYKMEKMVLFANILFSLIRIFEKGSKSKVHEIA
jgi:hypothetical protein